MYVLKYCPALAGAKKKERNNDNTADLFCGRNHIGSQEELGQCLMSLQCYVSLYPLIHLIKKISNKQTNKEKKRAKQQQQPKEKKMPLICVLFDCE